MGRCGNRPCRTRATPAPVRTGSTPSLIKSCGVQPAKAVISGSREGRGPIATVLTGASCCPGARPFGRFDGRTAKDQTIGLRSPNAEAAQTPRAGPIAFERSKMHLTPMPFGNSMLLSRRATMKIARRFNAGSCGGSARSPGGRQKLSAVAPGLTCLRALTQR